MQRARGAGAQGDTHSGAASHITSQLQETRKGCKRGRGAARHRDGGPTERPIKGALTAPVWAGEGPEMGGSCLGTWLSPEGREVSQGNPTRGLWLRGGSRRGGGGLGAARGLEGQEQGWSIPLPTRPPSPSRSGRGGEKSQPHAETSQERREKQREEEGRREERLVLPCPNPSVCGCPGARGQSTTRVPCPHGQYWPITKP